MKIPQGPLLLGKGIFSAFYQMHVFEHIILNQLIQNGRENNFTIKVQCTCKTIMSP